MRHNMEVFPVLCNDGGSECLAVSPAGVTITERHNTTTLPFARTFTTSTTSDIPTIANEVVQPVLHSLVGGTNATLVISGENDDVKQALLLSSILATSQQLFNLIQHAKITFPDEAVDWRLRGSVFSVGVTESEEITDLLQSASSGLSSPSSTPQNNTLLRIRDDTAFGPTVPGLWEVDIQAPEEVQELLESIQDIMQPITTLPGASRSIRQHVAFCFTLQQHKLNAPGEALTPQNMNIVSRLTILRLARASAAATEPRSPKAGSALSSPPLPSRSLSSPPLPSRGLSSIPSWVRALSDVLLAIETRSPSIPFAVSAVTSLMRDAMYGKAGGVFLACAPNTASIGPAVCHFAKRVESACEELHKSSNGRRSAPSPRRASPRGPAKVTDFLQSMKKGGDSPRSLSSNSGLLSALSGSSAHFEAARALGSTSGARHGELAVAGGSSHQSNTMFATEFWAPANGSSEAISAASLQAGHAGFHSILQPRGSFEANDLGMLPPSRASTPENTDADYFTLEQLAELATHDFGATATDVSVSAAPEPVLVSTSSSTPFSASNGLADTTSASSPDVTQPARRPSVSQVTAAPANKSVASAASSVASTAPSSASKTRAKSAGPSRRPSTALKQQPIQPAPKASSHKQEHASSGYLEPADGLDRSALDASLLQRSTVGPAPDAEIATLKSEVQGLRTQLSAAKKQIRDYDLYRDVVETAIGRLQGDLQRVTQERDTAVKQARGLQGTLSRERSTLNMARKRAQDAERHLAEIQDQLNKSDDSSKLLTALRSRLAAARAHGTTTENTLLHLRDEATGEISALQSRLTAVEAAFQKERERCAWLEEELSRSQSKSALSASRAPAPHVADVPASSSAAIVASKIRQAAVVPPHVPRADPPRPKKSSGETLASSVRSQAPSAAEPHTTSFKPSASVDWETFSSQLREAGLVDMIPSLKEAGLPLKEDSRTALGARGALGRDRGSTASSHDEDSHALLQAAKALASEVEDVLDTRASKPQTRHRNHTIPKPYTPAPRR